jgi:basic membrane protein A
VQVESGYRGGALNLAARLCSTAAAGEVLASQQVVHLARRIEGLRFESRGRIPLKGLAEPVEVVRVTAGDNLTPPATPPRHAHRRQRRALGMAVVGLAVLAAAITVFFVTRPTGATASASGCELAVGSLTDHAFNEAVYDGLTRAVADYGTTIGGATSTQTPAAGLAALKTFLKHRCDLIATNALAQDIINPAARHHPSRKFLLLDPLDTPSLPNVLGVSFDVKQSAFLAGYVAAGVSKTGRVATFGAVPISTVTPYMDGFAAGVERYDRDQGADVRVLGWDPRAQRGTFIAQAGFAAFGDTAGARRIGENLISKGADILFPVAGHASLGAAAAARAHPGVLLVGVDFDQFFLVPRYADLWLTSVRKRYDVAVGDVMHLVQTGRFRGARIFTGDLANGGVDIAPFHDLASRVVVVGLMSAAACADGALPVQDTRPALQRAVDAANRRYGREWDCHGVRATPVPVVACETAGEDSFTVDEFRIIRGVALYWNGRRVSPSPRFIQFIDRYYRSNGVRKTSCRITRASLPYSFRCRLDGARRKARVTVDLRGEMSLYRVDPSRPPGTMAFGLGLP